MEKSKYNKPPVEKKTYSSMNLIKKNYNLIQKEDCNKKVRTKDIMKSKNALEMLEDIENFENDTEILKSINDSNSKNKGVKRLQTTKAAAVNYKNLSLMFLTENPCEVMKKTISSINNDFYLKYDSHYSPENRTCNLWQMPNQEVIPEEKEDILLQTRKALVKSTTIKKLSVVSKITSNMLNCFKKLDDGDYFINYDYKEQSQSERKHSKKINIKTDEQQIIEFGINKMIFSSKSNKNYKNKLKFGNKISPKHKFSMDEKDRASSEEKSDDYILTNSKKSSILKKKLSLINSKTTSKKHSSVNFNFNNILETDKKISKNSLFINKANFHKSTKSVNKNQSSLLTIKETKDSDKTVTNNTTSVKVFINNDSDIDSDISNSFEKVDTEDIEVISLNKHSFNEQDEYKIILQNLINEYYLDIKQNTSLNYEDYVVNNLTIVCVLSKLAESIKLKNLFQYKLTEEEKYAVENFDKNKKILFLDLDETLIHADFYGEYEENQEQGHWISLNIENNITNFLIYMRPFTIEFLQYASDNFNLILFTAGMKCYADAILNFIDPFNQFFKLKLYRDACIQYDNFFVKDLSIIPNFNLKDMVIIDNCIYSFAINLKNGILIPSYYSGSNDDELVNLTKYLEEKIKYSNNCCETNDAYFELTSIKNFLSNKLENEGLVKKGLISDD